MKLIYENIPHELRDHPQWVNWKAVERDGKITKPPYQPDGSLAKTDDPLTWSTFDTIKEVEGFNGVGFVLTRDDPFTALDFDHCRCPAFDGIDSEISGGLNMVLPEIADHIRRLDTYTEVSPSGKGIRVVLRGVLPVAGRKKGRIEVYQSGHYVTLTGHIVDGYPRTIENRQPELNRFYQDVFLEQEESQQKPDWSDLVPFSEYSLWSDPVPFNEYSLLPKFPVEMIPGICGKMARTLAESCQVDTGLPGVMTLAVLSTAIGGKLMIDLQTHIEPGNLYLITIAESGDRKTEVLKRLSRPIYFFQKQQQEALLPIIQKAENQRRIWERQLEKLQEKAVNTDEETQKDEIIRDCNALIQKMAKYPPQRKPVYIADDVTPEALGQIMADNNERMAILTAEGGLFRIIAGLYHHGQANFDLFQKSHAADSWSNNRVGREAKTMETPVLSLGLAVQPSVIDEIGKNSEFRGRGLLARFLYALCQSTAGFRLRHNVTIPEDIKAEYQNLIISLMKVDGKHTLVLSPEGQTVWNDFYNEIEVRLRPGGELEHLKDWGSKLPGAVARISGLLHCAEHGTLGISKQISADTVMRAAGIGGYFLEHAKAVFGLMGEDERIITAKKILDYIKRRKPWLFKGRDLFNFTNCQSMKKINPGLEILIEREYIREAGRLERDNRSGRPEAPIYEVNPKIFLKT